MKSKTPCTKCHHSHRSILTIYDDMSNKKLKVATCKVGCRKCGSIRLQDVPVKTLIKMCERDDENERNGN